MLKNKNFLLCLTGLPASGKTTFAKILKLNLEARFPNCSIRIVDPDIIRYTMSPNKFDYKVEPQVREQSLQKIDTELRNGSIVISDDLNYYSSMRHDLKILADNLDIDFGIIYISTPFEICLKWNKNRGEPIPNEIIIKIHQKFDEFGKYKWDRPLFEIDLSQIRDLNVKIKAVADELIKKMRFPQKRLQKDKQLEKTLVLENKSLDKLTRNLVGKLLQYPSFVPLKKKIIKARKFFVKLYKNQALPENEIAPLFKDYLEKTLAIKISDELIH
ncbi:MAG: AAA family ATPase [Candidatus Thorarchaeota archaeon]